MRWVHVWGVGLLAGIGFTMSMFITVLAFEQAEHIIAAKIAIMFGSLLSAILGVVWLLVFAKHHEPEQKNV